MKKLFAVIMSLQLIIAPVAMAEGNSTASYMKQVMAITTGVIGSNIITTCSLASTQPSMWLYFAGSLVMIGDEIFSAKEFKEYLNKRTKDIALEAEKIKIGDEVGEIPLESLKAQLDNEEKVKDFVKKRKTWMAAIAVIYWAAMAVAIIELILEKNPVTNKSGDAGCKKDSGLSKVLAFLVTAAWSALTGTVSSGSGGKVSQYAGYATALLPLVDSTGSIVSTAYNTPIARIITFGVSGGLTTWIAVDLGNKQGKLEDNIELMDKAIKNFKEDPTTTISEDDTTTPGGEDDKNSDKNNPKVKRLASDLPKSCFSNSSQGMNYSEGGCKNSIKIPPVKFDSNFNIPTLSRVSNLANQMAQSVANGDMAGAGNIAGEIGAMASQVKKVKDDLQNELNKRLKAEGKPPMDFDKSIKERMAGMEADFMKANNITPPKMANSNASIDDLVKESSKDSTPEMVAAVQPSTAAPAAGMPGFSESLNEEDPSIQSGVTVTEGLDQFESSVEDIAKTPEVSIFKQVSNRYILNYTKIFERRKTPEPVVDEPKK